MFVVSCSGSGSGGPDAGMVEAVDAHVALTDGPSVVLFDYRGAGVAVMGAGVGKIPTVLVRRCGFFVESFLGVVGRRRPRRESVTLPVGVRR